MNDDLKNIEYLKLIQGIITRMSSAMLSIKRLSLIVFALITGFAVNGDNIYFNLLLFFFILLFLFLDMSYYRQEKIFIKLYNEVREQKKIDFTMDTSEIKKTVKLRSCFGSFAIAPFYVTLLLFNVLIIVYGYTLDKY